MYTPTASPLPTPAARRPAAARSTSRRRSANVSAYVVPVSDSPITAIWSLDGPSDQRSTQFHTRLIRPPVNHVAHGAPRESSSTPSYGVENSIPRSFTTASQYPSPSCTERRRRSSIVSSPCVRMRRVPFALRCTRRSESRPDRSWLRQDSRSMRIHLCAAVLWTAVLAAPVAAAAQTPGCPGVPDSSGVPRKPGPAIRFGLTPQVQVGQLGTGAVPPRVPEDAGKQIAALDRLRPANGPLVLRLHRFFWSDGQEAVIRFLDLTRLYTSHGFQVELQLRYHPTSEQEGDIAAWTAFVREVVDRFGPNPNVIAIQVTNEVNLTFSPDSSDGSFDGSRDALIQGVIAAKDEARKRGFDGLAIGFNWAYRSDPSSEASFWGYLRDHGGRPFVASLDWVGLDAYPGTFFPPAEAPGRERDGMVNAFSSFRCYLASAGIPDSVPIHVEENGYPTGDSPDRSEARQVEALQAMVGAVQDFRGTYDISDYRWFDLRDSDSTSPNFQQRYGLLRDDYTEKPAFGAYRDLIGRLSVRDPAAATPGAAPHHVRRHR